MKYATVQEYIDGEIARLENRLSKAEKAIEDLTKTGGVIDQLNKAIATLQSGKLDKEDFTAYKEATAVTLGLLQAAIENLTALTAGFPEGKTIKEYVDGLYQEIITKLDDYLLKSTFEEFVKIAATKAELETVKAELEGRLESLEDLLKGEWGDKTVQEYIDGQISALQGQLDQITNSEGTGRLDVLETAAAKYFEQVDKIWGLIKFADGYTGEYGDGLQGYIDAGDMWALNAAKDYTDEVIALLVDQLNDIFKDIFSRVQSIVLVPAYEDGKLSVVGGGAEVNTFKIMPTDAAKDVVALFSSYPEAFSLDVKTVATRAGGELPFKLTVTDVKLNAANADKGWVDVYVDSNFNTLSASDQAKSYSAALVIDGPGASISSPFYGVFVDESIVRYKLIPLGLHGDPEDVIIAWNYEFYDDICDTLIAKVWVDGDRDKLMGSGRTEKSKNVVSGTDYTQGTGAITKHTNVSSAVDINLLSKAEYGVSDSTYVSTYQKYDSVDDITYIGELYYVVKARPADAVIELDPVEAKVGDTQIAVKAIQAAYDFHKEYYSNHHKEDVFADFAGGVTVDSYKVTVDGAASSVSVSSSFGYAGGEETTSFSLSLNKAGSWKLTVYTHFAGVKYTFVIPINVE